MIASAGGDTAALVASTGVGLVAAPDDPVALAARFAEAAATPPAQRAWMGGCARRTYQERMSLPVGLDQFEDILTKATQQKGPA